MTHQEAIHWIEGFQDNIIHKLDFDDKRFSDALKATQIAKEAIEKQIPKPKHKYNGYRCVCGEQVAKNQDYCEYCGQRLEVEE